MFDFKASPQLAAEVLEHLFRLRVLRRRANADEIELERADLAKNLVSMVNSAAQAARYEPGLQFAIIKNGRFMNALEDEIGGSIPMPAGSGGNELMAKLAQEFLAWAKERAPTLALTKGPIAELRVEGESIVARVHPPATPAPDPTFVKAIQVE